MGVDYGRYVTDPFAGVNQGLQSLSQVLQYQQQMNRQQGLDAQAKQLHDLQVARLQEEQDYQKGLKSAIAAPRSLTEVTQGTVEPIASLASLGLSTPDYQPLPSAVSPVQPQDDIAGLQANVDKYPGLAVLTGSTERLAGMKAAAPLQPTPEDPLAGQTAAPVSSLASLGIAPEFSAQPPKYNGPMQPGMVATTKTESPLQAGQRFATEQGRYEDAAKMVSLDDSLAQMKAKLDASGGDMTEYYKAKQGLEDGKAFIETYIKPFVNKPEALKAMWPQIQKAAPKFTAGMKPEDFTTDGENVLMPLRMGEGGPVVPGKALRHKADGTTEVLDLTDKEAMLDKRFQQQNEMQQNQFAQQAKLQQAQLAAADARAERTAARTAGAMTTKLDTENAKVVIKALPKLRDDAQSAQTSLERMGEMVKLIDQGNAGAVGRLKAMLAPEAEALGFNSKSMSDAQLYQLMSKSIAGSMRQSVVGPGPVSNYENQLLQSISGGGRTAAAAAKQLLTLYGKSAQEKIGNYNDSIDSVSEYSPSTKKLYKKVGSRASTAGGDTRPPLSAIFGTGKKR